MKSSFDIANKKLLKITCTTTQ